MKKKAPAGPVEVEYRRIGDPPPANKGQRTYSAAKKPKRKKKKPASKEELAATAARQKTLDDLRQWAGNTPVITHTGVSSVPTAAPKGSTSTNWNDTSEDGSMWDR